MYFFCIFVIKLAFPYNNDTETPHIAPNLYYFSVALYCVWSIGA